MEIKICPKCEATWMGGQLFWKTGKAATEADLAGLVCDRFSDETCINPAKGTKHDGDTWEKRLEAIDKLEDELT